MVKVEVKVKMVAFGSPECHVKLLSDAIDKMW